MEKTSNYKSSGTNEMKAEERTGFSKEKSVSESAQIINSFESKLNKLDGLLINLTEKVSHTVGFQLRPTGEGEEKDMPTEGCLLYDLNRMLIRLDMALEKLEDIDYNLGRFIE